MEYKFTANYGHEYIKGLTDSMKKLGFKTIKDPQTQGEDGEGYIITDSQKAYTDFKDLYDIFDLVEEDDEYEKWKEGEEILSKKHSDHLIAIYVDWKHFDYKHDQKRLKSTFDVTLNYVDGVYILSK